MSSMVTTNTKARERKWKQKEWNEEAAERGHHENKHMRMIHRKNLVKTKEMRALDFQEDLSIGTTVSERKGTEDRFLAKDVDTDRRTVGRGLSLFPKLLLVASVSAYLLHQYQKQGA